MLRAKLFAGALLSCLASEPAPAEVHRVAPNVYFVKDKRGSPLVFQMVVNAGCWDEANGQCVGLAHWLEHLILVGRNPEHRDAAVRMFSSGYANGWTNKRATVYVHSVPAISGGPKADLEQLSTFYARRLNDFTITDDEVARERNVVVQEHDFRVGAKPPILFIRELYRRLLPEHVAGQWTIGTRESIRALSIEAARDFHRAWYVINNASFVVMGDLKPSAVAAIAERTLAGLAARPLPERNFSRPIIIKPGREDLRRSHPTQRTTQVTVLKLVHWPEFDLEQQRAVRAMLMAFLSGQMPGSLAHAVTEVQRLAAGTPHVRLQRAAPGALVLTLNADVAPAATAETLSKAMTSWIGGLSTATLSPDVLSRLQARHAADRANADMDPHKVFDRLISNLADGWTLEQHDAWPARVAAVTEADMANLA
jgi:zinc protease